MQQTSKHLTLWGLDKIAAMFQTIFSNAFFNENMQIASNISLKFVLKIPIHNTPPLVQVMAWRRSGDKPLSE